MTSPTPSPRIPPDADTPPRAFPSALAALRRHPAPTALAVAGLATSLVAVGAFALALAQAAKVETWYRAGLPAMGRDGFAADVLELLGRGRMTLAVAAGAAVLALVMAGRAGMRMTAATRRDEVRAAGSAWGRRTLLAQAVLTGLAGAVVASVVLVTGVWLALRVPRQAAFDGLPVVGAGELAVVLAVMSVAGVAACGLGGLLAARALART